MYVNSFRVRIYSEHWNVNTKFEILLMNCFILNVEGSTALQRILKNKIKDLLLDGSFDEISVLSGWVCYSAITFANCLELCCFSFVSSDVCNPFS